MSYTIRKFQPEADVIKPFDCGVADLNGFLLETNGDTPNATLYDETVLMFFDLRSWSSDR